VSNRLPSTPYKVLFIHYGGGVGGASISVLQLASALQEKRYAPRVIFTQSGPILKFSRDLNVPSSVADLPSAFFYGAHVRIRLRMLMRFLAHFRATVGSAEKLINREQPDLVHLNTSVLIPAAIGIKRAKVPLVWHVREVPGPNLFLRNWKISTISRLADLVVATSQSVAKMFPSSTCVEVIHNALDLRRFQVDESSSRLRIRSELGLSESAPVVIMIGNVQEVKGHYLLLAAAGEVVKVYPDVRFLFVAGGVGPEYAHGWRGRVKSILGLPYDNLERIKRQIQRLGLGEHFIFTGYRMDIPELIMASDIVSFLPQAAEGFGRPLIEAMAAGRPVIATDIGPTREIVGEGTSVLVPVGDAEAVAKAIVTLLQDRRYSQTLGMLGRQRAGQRFGMERYLDRITKVYERVMSKTSVCGS